MTINSIRFNIAKSILANPEFAQLAEVEDAGSIADELMREGINSQHGAEAYYRALLAVKS